MRDGIAQGREKCGGVCQGLVGTLWQLDGVESEFVECVRELIQLNARVTLRHISFDRVLCSVHPNLRSSSPQTSNIDILHLTISKQTLHFKRL